jgi:hypothetical protein
MTLLCVGAAYLPQRFTGLNSALLVLAQLWNHYNTNTGSFKRRKRKKKPCGDWGDDPGVSSNVVTHIFSLFPEVKGIEGCIYHSF